MTEITINYLDVIYKLIASIVVALPSPTQRNHASIPRVAPSRL